MKKIIIFLTAATLIFGFAGLSMAATTEICPTCEEPGVINRGCDVDQGNTCTNYPFDYEDDDSTGMSNYCEVPKGPRRVMFPACNCVEDFGDIGDVIDIRMEILVNGQPGDNGAYWAETVDSIDMKTYFDDAAACKDGHNYNDDFAGDETTWDYWYWNAAGEFVSGGDPAEGSFTCWTSMTNYPQRVTVIDTKPEIPNAAHGYTITTADDAGNLATWAIDIPLMRFDLQKIQIGDTISVEICLAKADDETGQPALGGICSDTGCCCVFDLGTIGCCLEELILGGKLIYPYATEMDNASWWYGMVITNLSDVVAEAEVTIYEQDGDTVTVTSADAGFEALAIPARGMFVINSQSLLGMFGGTIGDSKGYFEVNADATVSGFMFIANEDEDYAMGYLPVSRPIYDVIVDVVNGDISVGSLENILD